MSDRLALLHALLRTDLPSFTHRCFLTLNPGEDYVDSWHIAHMAHHLDRVTRGECRRLIINVPPRSLKSICVTVGYTALRLGLDPSLKIISVSYANELSRKLAGDFRTVVDSAWYGALFPRLQLRRPGRIMEAETSAHGYRLATSVGGSVLGRGADLIVIDDPIKADEALSEAKRRSVNEFYDNTLYTRLNNKNEGAIVIVMQRLHEDDLVGHVLAKGEEWEVVKIPAIATETKAYPLGRRGTEVRPAGDILLPELASGPALEHLRRTLGSLSFSAQYQQEPLPADGNVVKREWIRYYDTPPSSFDFTVASWDTASTIEEQSDYSVGTVWGLKNGSIYLLEVLRDRWEAPDLRRLIIQTHETRKLTATLIEDTELGRAAAQDIRRTQRWRPILWRPHYDKQARMLAQSPKFEAGQVLLPREATWLGTYLHELLGFPTARHDDQVDSTSQALDWLSQRMMVGIPRVRPSPARPLGARMRRPR